MWVIFNMATGESTEDDRVATFADLERRIDERSAADENAMYGCRWESSEQAVGGEVALAQIWQDGRWLDYARTTPDLAVVWAQGEHGAPVRVVDWIEKDQVIWP